MSQSRARKQRRTNSTVFMLALESALMMGGVRFTIAPRDHGKPLLPPPPDAASRARVAAAEAKRARKRARAVQLMKRG